MNNTQLYDSDYESWLREQIQALQQGDLKALDISHLVEELEALVRGEKSAVESFTYQIMIHLLLLEYWSEEHERNHRHWLSEVYNFQFQLNERLSTNLKTQLINRLDYIYGKARKSVVAKTGLTDQFPAACPYSLLQILGNDE